MAGASSSASPAPLIVAAAVEAFCDLHGIGSGPVVAERLGEGHSNITFLVDRGDARFVLRRPPRPPLPPSAHDMLRESAIVAALGRAGARVPRVLAVCDDVSLLGVPFYLMTLEPGVPVDEVLPPAIDTPEGRAQLGLEFVEALVELHAIDPIAAGLGAFGKPEGYLVRQLRRFRGLWEVNRTRDLPQVGVIADLLEATLPASGTATVVHGDYRVGNLLVAETAPARISAILDWELATVGDPLADLGYLVSSYADPASVYQHPAVALSPVTRQDGFPSAAELVRCYAARSGRDVSDLPWYECLAHWKAAIFCENMYQRFLAGDRDDAFAAAMADGVPAKLDAASEALERIRRARVR